LANAGAAPTVARTVVSATTHASATPLDNLNEFGSAEPASNLRLGWNLVSIGAPPRIALSPATEQAPPAPPTTVAVIADPPAETVGEDSPGVVKLALLVVGAAANAIPGESMVAISVGMPARCDDRSSMFSLSPSSRPVQAPG
jgi:hypothetical protein